MTAVQTKAVGVDAQKGITTVLAIIVADETPEQLPTNGAGIKGMLENQVFAPMSMLYVVGEAEEKLFIANEKGQFVPQ